MATWGLSYLVNRISAVTKQYAMEGKGEPIRGPHVEILQNQKSVLKIE